MFVAHREEILVQSLTTFRNVLQDGCLGEHFAGENKPVEWKHVFASVLSLASKGVETRSLDSLDVVAINEYHHTDGPNSPPYHGAAGTGGASD